MLQAIASCNLQILLSFSLCSGGIIRGVDLVTPQKALNLLISWNLSEQKFGVAVVKLSSN